MQVEIVALDANARVHVRSALGAFTARWDGELPPIGASRAVELAFTGDLAWGIDAVAVAPQPATIGNAGSAVVLHATLEDAHEDGGVVLRLGPSIALLTITGEPPPIGATVRLVGELTLYDTRI